MPHKPLPDQSSTTEFRAVVLIHGLARWQVQRRTAEELDAAIDTYRGFGYDVKVEQRECGPWTSVENDERQADD